MANLGSTSPAATAPLGMVKAGPDTTPGTSQPAFTHCSGYNRKDAYILGFSHNRLHGTGIPDYGNVLMMPAQKMTPEKATRYGRKVKLDTTTERAEPGRYAVTLANPEIDVELIATTRCALHRYDFKEGDAGAIIFDVAAAQGTGRSKGGAVSIDPGTSTVRGWTHSHGSFSGRYGGYRVYFSAQVDRDLQGYGVWSEQADGVGALQPGVAATETNADPAHFGAWLEVGLGGAGGKAAGEVRVRVCLSYVDQQGADLALKEELSTWSLKAHLESTRAAWATLLGRLRVEGASEVTRKRLYTALYHALQMPTVWSDVDGRYRGFDGAVHIAEGWRYVTDMSLWDTFRTAHPLYALLYPEVQRDALQSLVAMTSQGGYVPRWPMGGGDGGSMIGAHAASVLADSLVKGVGFKGAEVLYEGLSKTLSGPLPAGAYGGLGGISSFHEIGYVSREADGGSVSKTLEYAYDCACMATIAERLGRDATKWQACAGHYKNLWDPETGFFRARREDGKFTEPFDPLLWVFDGNPEYVEGSAWQWAWFAPHDDAGLRALHGSDESFVSKLTVLMEKAAQDYNPLIPSMYYYHGNEPDIDAAWLFAEAGRPDLTQRWTRQILHQMVQPTDAGLPGNDDGGTLAAWTVFATVGLYPRPGLDRYILSLPMVDRAELDLPGGALIIEAKGAGDLPGALEKMGTPYLNEVLSAPTISHLAIADGARLTWSVQ